MKSSPRTPLRIAAWVAFLTVLTQVSVGALLISGQRQLEGVHNIMGHVTLTVAIIVAGVFIVRRRVSTALNVVVAIALAVMVVLQYATGESGLISLHAFTGVIIGLLALLLALWA